jgi:hypothetical protein
MILNATKSIRAFYQNDVIKSRHHHKIYSSSSRWQFSPSLEQGVKVMDSTTANRLRMQGEAARVQAHPVLQ